ncbi:hypothetical protein CRUP_032236 [Coryphaenoides rupestris]|nr:hypothetical protein CRUP_032236 [Coryphaenoides rupestris]
MVLKVRSRMVVYLWFLLLLVTMVTCNREEPAGVRIRITENGLEIVKIVELNLTQADLLFQPDLGLLFQVKNSSITLSFQRQILYWFFYDTGTINASADGVNIHTALKLVRDQLGRLKINNITCDANISKMRAKFSGTLGRVYDFLATFLTTGMRFLLNQQICPALNDAALTHINSMLEGIPVRSAVDSYVGIDYSLLSDPVVTSRGMDMHFRLYSSQLYSSLLYPSQLYSSLLYPSQLYSSLLYPSQLYSSLLYPSQLYSSLL